MVKYQFKAKQSLSLENSFGVIKQQDDIELSCSLGFNSPTYGWFEVYDEESGGEDWYAEGSLELNGKAVLGYDGVFALPDCIIDKLKELGYDTSEVECD